MKLVIDISDGKWRAVKDGTWCGSVEIANGTPLTEIFEGIKADIKGLKHEHTDVSGYRWWDNAVDNALSIIDSHINEVDDIKQNYIHLSVIDDIKAEIENEQNPYLWIKECGGFAGGYYDGLAKTLKIIDRHIRGGNE